MNKLFLITIIFCSIVKAEQINITNNIPADISNDLKIEWFRQEEGKPLNFEEKTGKVFTNYNLKSGNNSINVPEGANSFNCSGTTSKAKQIDKKSKLDRCSLSLTNFEKITANKSYTLKIPEKCSISTLNSNECHCNILVE